MIGSPLAAAYEAPGPRLPLGHGHLPPELPRGARSKVERRGTLEEILLGPAHENDGTLNLFGALRTSMATCGYETIREFHKAEVMVAPALQTEGKQLQRAQAVGMGQLVADDRRVPAYDAVLVRRLRRPVRPADRAARAGGARLLRARPLLHARRRDAAPAGPAGIILSGGPRSVYAAGRRPRSTRAARIWACLCSVSATAPSSSPSSLGGAGRAHRRRRVRAHRRCTSRSPAVLLEGLAAASRCWMSHRDSIIEAPPASPRRVHEPRSPVAAFEDRGPGLYGVQFHPEVVHTPRARSCCGSFLLRGLRLRARPGRPPRSSRTQVARDPRPGRPEDGCSAACPAASTPRSPPRSSTARSATS